MPTVYEMALIVRALGHVEVSEALKRCLTTLLKHGAVIENVENLGVKRLPYKMNRFGDQVYEGHYFLVNFDAPKQAHAGMQFRKDKHVIKSNMCLKDDGWVRPCSLPDAPECEFGEIRNPNYEKTARRRHGFRWF